MAWEKMAMYTLGSKSRKSLDRCCTIGSSTREKQHVNNPVLCHKSYIYIYTRLYMRKVQNNLTYRILTIGQILF